MAKRPADHIERYWRTCERKLGEGSDLVGKALTAAAGAAMLGPLAVKGEIRFPSLTVGVILVIGIAIFLLGIHLQADAKPDE